MLLPTRSRQAEPTGPVTFAFEPHSDLLRVALT